MDALGPLVVGVMLIVVGIVLVASKSNSSSSSKSQTTAQPVFSRGNVNSRAASDLTSVTLFSNGRQRLEYIPLPRLDEIHFVSASSSLFKVDMPDVTRSYADRLLSRELEKYADNGWILDEFEFKPWEPVFEPVERWRLLIPFMQPRFKCIGVKAHLRRK